MSLKERAAAAFSLDRMQYKWLVLLALFMAMAPWPMGPEPHLYEKFQMLQAGTLSKPIDIFDVFWHGFPLALLIAKLVKDARARFGSSAS